MQASTKTYWRGTAARVYTTLWFAAALASVGVAVCSVVIGSETLYPIARDQAIEDRAHWAVRVMQAQHDNLPNLPVVQIDPGSLRLPTPEALASVDAIIAEATAQRASNIKWFTCFEGRNWPRGWTYSDYTGCNNDYHTVTADERTLVGRYERNLPFHSWSWLNVYTLLFSLGSVAATAAPILFVALLHWIGTGRRGFGWTW